MRLTGLLFTFALLHTSTAAAAQPVTTSETDTADPPETVVIVSPTEGTTFIGMPDAMFTVTAEFTGDVVALDILVDDKTTVDCVIIAPPQCEANVTLNPGAHVLVARGRDQFENVVAESIPVNVDVTTENVTTGDSSGSGGSESSGSGTESSGGGTDGSTGSDSGGTTPDKGCDCNTDGDPAPGLALVGAALVLVRRRRTR